jgi:hypothetical protein
MENERNSMEKQTALLKESRLEFLRMHKSLVDFERANYERINGTISSGQFLNLLVNDSNFEWLRKFSILIVEIDEMLDLDDGFSEQMIEKHLSQMRKILDINTSDEIFNKKFENALQTIPELKEKNEQLKKLLSNE